MKSRRMGFFLLFLGLVLAAAAIMGWIDDMWLGIGGAWVGVGLVFAVRYLRYQTDEDYREKVDVANSDERNRYLAMKAWAWTGYILVFVTALATLGLYIARQMELAKYTGMTMCLIVVVYYCCYWYLAKKY